MPSSDTKTTIKSMDKNCKFATEEYRILWTVENFNSIPFTSNHPILGPSFRLGTVIDSTWQLDMSKKLCKNGPNQLGFQLSKIEENEVWDTCVYTVTIKSKDESNALVCVQDFTVGAKDEMTLKCIDCPLDSNSDYISSVKKCDIPSDNYSQVDVPEPVFPTQATNGQSMPMSVKDLSKDAVMNLLLNEKDLLVECEIKYVYMVDNPDETLGEPSVQLIIHDLRELYNSKKFSDIVVCAGGAEFRAHKNILCLRASVLDEQLQEKNGKTYPTEKLQLDMTESVAERMLRYIYMGEIPENLNADECQSLISASRKYGIKHLREHCSNILNRLENPPDSVDDESDGKSKTVMEGIEEDSEAKTNGDCIESSSSQVCEITEITDSLEKAEIRGDHMSNGISV